MNFIFSIILLDSVAIGHFMLSRPIFLMAIAALFTSDYIVTAKIALITELLWLNVIPYGKNIPYNSSIMSIVAFNISHFNKIDPILAVLVSILPGIVYKRIEIYLRQLADITNNFKALNLKFVLIVGITILINFSFIKVASLAGSLFKGIDLNTKDIEVFVLFMLVFFVLVSSLKRIIADIK